MNRQQKLIVILGPTASGKTELALQIAQKYNGYIISADSRQIYKGLDIGTAKPQGKFDKKTNSFLVKKIPHYLIDCIEPDKNYNLADYQKNVFDIIKNKKSLPILAGGTGLYISSIIDNYQLPQGKIDKELRKKLEEKNLTSLLEQLKKFDSNTYNNIDKKNKRRVVRALEYVLANQESFFKNIKQQPSPYNILIIGLNKPKEKLIKSIDNRVDQMLASGLISETETLFQKYPNHLPAFDTIGYQETKYYLRGLITMGELAWLIKKNTRQYAKRQLTWFKRNKKISWIENPTEAIKLIDNFLI